MKLSVDHEVCEGHGLCVGIAPEIFDLDEEDVLHIRPSELAREELERVTVAVASCPKNALSYRA
jgi:ferredoxin